MNGNGAKRPGILVIGAVPPPWSGPEMDNVGMLASPTLQKAFSLVHVNTQKHTKNEQKGTLSAKNLVLEAGNAVRILVKVVKTRPTIVYLSLSQTDMGFLRDAVYFSIAVALGRKVAVYLPGGAYLEHYRRSRFPGLIRKLFSRADIVFALSGAVREQVGTILGSEDDPKVRVIPVDITLSPAGDRFARDNGKPLRVLHMGHVSVAKGAVDLVRAIPGVLTRFPETRFLFAGEFANRSSNISWIPDPHGAEDKIRRFAEEHGIGHALEFLGTVTGPDKTSMLENTDIQVLASYSEGCPRAVLEGMLAGGAVVVSPVGCLADVVAPEVNGLWVEPGKPEQIAEALCRLLGDVELRGRMGRANRVLVEKGFSAEARYTKMRDAFLSLLE
ncbi:MAG: glycosyltransferase family 4 protein [Desulfatibacillaceae bacterium]